MEYLADGGRSATVTANRETTVVKIDRDFKDWASLPCQLRLGKAFQSVLIERLRQTTRELASALRRLCNDWSNSGFRCGGIAISRTVKTFIA
mgnify:CR=1 FL=1